MRADRPGRSGLGLLLEGFVVLVSILAAFFLEGWRDDRQAARELGQELASVARELERNRDLVAADLAAVGRVMAGAETLLARLNEYEDTEFVEVPDTVAWAGTVWSPTLDPSLGALDALISSGRLAKIESEPLRSGLAGLRDVFRDAAQDDILAERITFDQLLPQIHGSDLLAALIQVTTEFILPGQRVGGSSHQAVANVAIPSHGWVAYPNTPAIRAALSMKLVWYTSTKGELQSVEAHLADLIVLASAEIN